MVFIIVFSIYSVIGVIVGRLAYDFINSEMPVEEDALDRAMVYILTGLSTLAWPVFVLVPVLWLVGWWISYWTEQR